MSDRIVGVFGAAFLCILGVGSLITGCDHALLALDAAGIAGLTGYHLGRRS